MKKENKMGIDPLPKHTIVAATGANNRSELADYLGLLGSLLAFTVF